MFYTSLNYIKLHNQEKFPYFTYFIVSLFFGSLYWYFTKIKFSISNPVFIREIIYLIIFEIFTFGYIAILFTDVASRTALFKDATHDKLTAAFNYDAFDMDFRSLFQNNNTADKKFTMMMTNRFKKVHTRAGAIYKGLKVKSDTRLNWMDQK